MRLVLWSDYTETDVQAVVLQLKLLEQTLDTLAEFVQAIGQRALRVHCMRVMCAACVMCTACALYVHCMCTACALHVHCMCAACACACALHVHRTCRGRARRISLSSLTRVCARTPCLFSSSY